ncbi:tyrosine-type recombinase/integrase [Morganella morganii]|uniref:Tyrosine-type recombinase/integrase n=2 Tax=Bacteria TaxID=2 RepID=A0AAU6TVP0_UNCXX|nr:integrase arm-type DNA-binding domain-containing protein [Morganella morganii]HCE8950197.1 tyrosine-type recombinase/integrase [Morganella morganii]
MPLTVRQVETAKPKEKSYKLFDGGGLYLEVTSKGSRYWRMKYRFGGKEKRLAFGVYPVVTLAKAREMRGEAKKILNSGGDPGEIKKAEKATQRLNTENTFEALAHEWYFSRVNRWSLNYKNEIIRTFKNDVFPYIGSLVISDINPLDLLDVLKKIEKRGALEKARKVRQRCSEVFIYAINTGRAVYNPAANLSNVLTPPQSSHYPFLSVSELPDFLRLLSSYSGSEITKTATKIILLTGVRTKELRFARWRDIDLRKGIWEVPAEVMKMKRPHIVPLSTQVIDLFNSLKPLSEQYELVFVGRNSYKKPIGKESVNQVIELLGYKGRLTGHGFRHTMSTILHEKGYNSAWIETQLAHIDKNAIRGTYNHAQYLDGRREMMQWYADYMDELESSLDNVVNVNFK